jgi:hypothetical protein
MSEYVIFKLASGETIIGKKVESLQDTGDIINVENPIQLVPSSKDQVGLMPFMPFTAETVIGFTKANMSMQPAEPTEALVNQHKEIFSPIVLPSTQIIGG